MPITNTRTFASIQVDRNPDECFEIIEKIIQELKIKPKEIIKEKKYLHGKTKLSFLKNKFGEDFRILSKPRENHSVIEIYYNGVVFPIRPDEGPLVKPFYKKLCNIISSKPPIEVTLRDISDDEIKNSANERVHSDNISDMTHIVADEIAKLAKLKAEGEITEEEYEQLKNHLIDKM